jgi:aminoglycoside/choline kinase family phosphotransferase
MTNAASLARPDFSARAALADAFVAQAGWAGASRRMIAGDASFRRYERVTLGERVAVLMDAPPPWENVQPFVAVTGLLRQCAVSVPAIHAADEAHGFLLLEDLGDISFTRHLRATPQDEQPFYIAAVAALGAIGQASARHAEEFSQALPIYDEAVYLREAALLAEWLLPQIHGLAAARRLREEYLEIWRVLLNATPLEHNCLVHRDYHADNLLWLGAREGIARVGMIDYQDALWGDGAYDLVSLLEDARRDVAPATVEACLAQFSRASGEAMAKLMPRYRLLAAQRNAKIIGIFVRLCVRDGKRHYLDYLPRVWGHFLADIADPALAPLKAFIDAQVPAEWRGAFAADAAIGGIVP